MKSAGEAKHMNRQKDQLLFDETKRRKTNNDALLFSSGSDELVDLLETLLLRGDLRFDLRLLCKKRFLRVRSRRRSS